MWGSASWTTRREMLRICRKSAKNAGFCRRDVEDAVPYNYECGLFRQSEAPERKFGGFCYGINQISGSAEMAVKVTQTVSSQAGMTKVYSVSLSAVTSAPL